MIGAKVKQIRLEKNMSLSELSNKASIAKSYLSSIEKNDNANPSIQILTKIADVLDVPLHFFIENNSLQKEIDKEWERLAKIAIEHGVTPEQFEEYLQSIKCKK